MLLVVHVAQSIMSTKLKGGGGILQMLPDDVRPSTPNQSYGALLTERDGPLYIMRSHAAQQKLECTLEMLKGMQSGSTPNILLKDGDGFYSDLFQRLAYFIRPADLDDECRRH